MIKRCGPSQSKTCVIVVLLWSYTWRLRTDTTCGASRLVAFHSLQHMAYLYLVHARPEAHFPRQRSAMEDPRVQPSRVHGGSVGLKRRIGLIPGVGILCGLIIGSGIFVAPNGVLDGTNSAGSSLVLWALGGVIGTLGALCFAELGTTFPTSAEKSAYLERMFGPFVGFLYLWTYVLIYRSGSNAVKCLTFARYILKPVFPDCAIPEDIIVMVAILLACKY